MRSFHFGKKGNTYNIIILDYFSVIASSAAGLNLHHVYDITRTKTSIRYAKENDKEKRERRKERERKVEGKI